MTRRRGPALLYATSDGQTVPVDTEAVTDPRERALYRALAGRADQLADNADAEPESDGRPFGFTATSDTERSGD
jgi:hypothetical protein